MLDNLTPAPLGERVLEQIINGGDLSRLSPAERMSYYTNICESLGLNPLTKPLDYITLNGKVTLYAKRDCTDQLRKINGVSIIIISREVVEDCYIVTARATDRTGRSDESIGAVPIGNVKGEARSNAMMKAETKAKRRVTLSICGMGILDETEVPSVVNTYPAPVTYPSTEESTYPSVHPNTRNTAALDGWTENTANIGGYEEKNDDEEQDIINDMALDVKRLLREENPQDAYSLCESIQDTGQKAKLWSLLDPKERSALKKRKENA